LTLAAFAQREDARDVLLLNNDSSRTLLGIGSVIGTGSPRRQLQLKKLFPGASFKDLRGNIDTRLRKLRDGEYDAIVLAAAGLRRLSIPVEPGSLLSLEECIPAVGQGALALQCRADDVPTITVLKTINHLDTERAITAERSFMQTIGGGCKFPLAAHAVVTGSHVTMRCIIGDLSSYHSQHLTRSFALADVVEAGQDMAHTLRRMCLDNGIIV
jgi:hydroxymethylbilane synthase